MIHHHFTLRRIMIYSIWLFFNFTPIIQAHQVQCDYDCNMMIQDEERMYAEFKQMATSDSVKVIFFHIHVGNQSLNQGDDSTVYYTWIKNSFGDAIITLPSSFIAMSLSLYYIFIGTLNITLIDSSQGCYQRYSKDDDCKKNNYF